MFSLAKVQIREMPICFGFLTMPDNMEVLTYPDMVVYASGVKESEPFTSDKLSVSHEMGDTAFAGKTEEPCNEFHALFSVGVAPLVHHLKDNRKCHSIVDDTESEDVDIRVSGLPVGPVHGQGIRTFTGISFRMSLAMRSVLMTHSAISRWILRNEEQASASLSNAAASFVYAILCTLQSAHIIMLIAFILAKFISFPKCSLIIENKLLLLQWTLEFRNMVLMW